MKKKKKIKKKKKKKKKKKDKLINIYNTKIYNNVIII